MEIYLLVVIILLASCILLFALFPRVSTKPISSLLTNLQDGQIRQEALVRDELARFRLESVGMAREQRQEIVSLFQSLAQSIDSRIVELVQSQTAKLDGFSVALRGVASETSYKLDSNREKVDEC